MNYKIDTENKEITILGKTNLTEFINLIIPTLDALEEDEKDWSIISNTFQSQPEVIHRIEKYVDHTGTNPYPNYSPPHIATCGYYDI